MKSNMLAPTLVGAVIIAVGSAIPILNLLNCFCCAWLVLGGAVAAYIYIKDSAQKVSLGEGAILGALSGIIGSVLDTVLSVLFELFLGSRGMEQLRELVDRPEFPEEIRDFVLAILGSEGFSLIALILGFFVMLLFALIFATLGGIIGVAIFEKRTEAGADLPPPSAPPAPPGIPPTLSLG